MSRAISLYMDRVTQSLGALQELEKEANYLDEREQAIAADVPAGETSTPDGPPSSKQPHASCSLDCVQYERNLLVQLASSFFTSAGAGLHVSPGNDAQARLLSHVRAFGTAALVAV